jgi:hypothetical protein
MWALRNILPLTLSVLIPLTIAASYLRFIDNYDYIVEYEIDCDPEYYSCYVGCDDDECTSEYYYAVTKKYAKNLLAQCGEDITDCDYAQVCFPEEGVSCQISYCDSTDKESECTTSELLENAEDMYDFQDLDSSDEETTEEQVMEDKQNQYDL